MALLHHLEQVGFQTAPRPIGNGFAADGREMLEFIVGASPQPHAWSDEAAHRVGELLAELHVATSSFVAPPEPRWRAWFARDLPGERRVIGHGDLGPWNILAVGGRPIAFIDWDNAGPVDAVWELAQVAWQNAQLHDDDVAQQSALPDATTRAGQLGILLDGYGLSRRDRVGFVDKMVEIAIRSARQEAVDHAVNPGSEAQTAEGYPILWAITWRSPSAAWMLEHRALLEHALDAG